MFIIFLALGILVILTYCCLFLLNNFIVNHTYWLLSFGFILLSYLCYLIWLLIFNPSTTFRTTANQKSKNKENLSNHFFISFFLIVWTFLPICFVLPYSFTALFGENKVATFQVKSYYKDKTKYNCHARLVIENESSAFFSYCLTSEQLKNYPIGTTYLSTVTYKESYLGKIIHHIRLPSKLKVE